MEFHGYFLRKKTPIKAAIAGKIQAYGTRVAQLVELVEQAFCQEFSDQLIEDAVTGIFNYNGEPVPTDMKHLGKMLGRHLESFTMCRKMDEKQMLLSRVLGWTRSHAQRCAL